jgi:hypothetical protein
MFLMIAILTGVGWNLNMVERGTINCRTAQSINLKEGRHAEKALVRRDNTGLEI